MTWDDAIEKIKQVKQERDELQKAINCISKALREKQNSTMILANIQSIADHYRDLEGDSND